MSKDQYAAIIEKMEDGFALCELVRDDRDKVSNYRILEVNPAFEKHTGISTLKATGSLRSSLNPVPDDYILELCASSVQTGEPARIERYNDGLQRWYSIEIIPFESDRFVQIFRDITRQKHFQEAINEQNKLLERIYDTIPVLFIMWDPESRQYSLNRYAESVLGWTTAEANEDDFMARIFPERDYRTVITAFMEAPESKWQEWMCTARSGEIIPVDLYNIRLSNDTRISIGIDLRERKSADKLKDEFVSMVSHEIRTPLTVIIGSLAVANDERVSPEEVKELIKDAGIAAESMADIVENLLEISRHQSNRLFLQQDVTDIRSLARRVTEKLRERYPVINVVFSFPREIYHVMIDTARIERILTNLIENAVKYSPEGREIRVSARLDDDYFEVSVQDQGMGISKEDQEKLFHSFERVNEETSTAPGLGLGLRVCHILVEAHGGRIWVESDKDQGATFYFTVPLADTQNSPATR